MQSTVNFISMLKNSAIDEFSFFSRTDKAACSNCFKLVKLKYFF